VNKKSRKSIDPSLVVEVVGDGAIAGPVQGGAMITVLILDARQREDIKEAIRASKYLTPGDVITGWGAEKSNVALFVTLLQPVAAEMIIRLPLPRFATAIHGIVRTEYLYIQAGVPGDRIGHDIDAEKLILQVPNGGFENYWPDICRKIFEKDFREKGLSRASARNATRELIRSLERITSITVPNTVKAAASDPDDGGEPA
jgi:hypothetical protein